MKKKLLALLLVVALAVTSVITGTLAYQIDEEADVNVMTLGDVDIKQDEYNADGSEFTQDKDLYPGVYVDKVVEVTNVGDRDAYGLTVTVTDDKMGALKAEQTLTKVGEGPVDTILFENTYTSRPDDVQVPIGIKKIVKNIGPESIGPENFAFVLQNLDTGDALEVSTDSSGFAEFLLNFKEEDVGNTFHYQITERNDGRENVTYSTEVFQFAITVELGAENQLLVTKTVDDEVVEDVIALYENIYNSESATPVEPPKTGDDRPVALYLALAGVSGMMLLALLAKRRRKNS